MNEITLSVIVPVYNGEDTLERCIQSIVKQTYKDFELLIVNDGSGDASLAIAKRYEEQDKRVIVLSQENKGVSAARNYGIQKARGKWITFVDADDYLDIHCFDIAFGNEKINLVELVLWDRIDIYRNRQEEKRIFVDDEWKHNSIKDLVEKVFYNRNGNLEICSVCGRLFRSDIIEQNEIRFDEAVRLGEDMIFMLDYLKVIKHYYYIHRTDYHRSMVENSAMHGFNVGMKDQVITLLQTLKKHIDLEKNENIMNAYQIFVLRGPVTTYLECYLCNSQNKDGRKQRSKELNDFLKMDVVEQEMKKIRYKMLSNRLKVKLFCIRHRWIDVLDYWYRRKEYM